MLAARLSLRTQFLLASLTVLLALTAASLLVVRRSVRNEIRGQTSEALAASVRAFERMQQQQQEQLARIAALVSELPTLKAVMTSDDPATIQDASNEFFAFSGSDLLVLADADRRVMAIHTNERDLPRTTATRLLAASSQRGERFGWWQHGGDLFRIVIHPITAGTGKYQRLLGTLVTGRRINAAVAEEIGRLAGSEIVLTTGGSIVALSLRDTDPGDLRQVLSVGSTPRELSLAGRHFEVGAVSVATGPPAEIRCYMLLPLDANYAFLKRLNRTLALLGLLAALVGGVLANWMAHAITLPLSRLVAAVRALAGGNSGYKLEPLGSAEVGDLATAFTAMRKDLAESQRRQLAAERLAALGRAAGTISHDLRHHLAALVANAEFLYDANDLICDRDEAYREIERASGHMTELIGSLVEIAREQRTLSVSEDRLADVVRRAAAAVRANPEFRMRRIDIEAASETAGTFDGSKLERAFFNLLLNACQATGPEERVGVAVTSDAENFTCRIWDQGRGLPDSVRETLFEPFVSAGKENGTGLGLAIARKIIHDHAGSIEIEETSSAGTTFIIRLPRWQGAIQNESVVLVARTEIQITKARS